MTTLDLANSLIRQSTYAANDGHRQDAEELREASRRLREAADRIYGPLADELVELLTEAGTEIYNAHGPGNIVAARLRAMRDRIQQAQVTK